MIQQRLQQFVYNLVEQAIKRGDLPDFEIPKVEIMIPTHDEFGDYATNIAFQSANVCKMAPDAFLNIIIQGKHDTDFVQKMEIKSGFLNLFLSNTFLQSQVSEILEKKEQYSRCEIGKGKKALIEFVSANPTGPLTLPNGKNGFVGDVLSHVYEKAGYDVTREYYVNDRGVQIQVLGKSIHYAMHPENIPEDDDTYYRGPYIDELAKEFEGNDLDDYELGKQAVSIILETYIKKTVDRMGISFDHWFSESSLHEQGKVEEVKAHLEKQGNLFEQDGALFMKTTQYGDDKDRALIKSDGEATYFYSDVAYFKEKLIDRKIDKNIIVLGADHHGYVGRMKAAVLALGGKEEQFEALIMQLVKLTRDGKEVRMSKRKGEYVLLDWLLDEVGEDVARFFFLMFDVNTPMNFDLDIAKKQSDENPVYYVQYAHARIASILRNQAYEKGDFSVLEHDAELKLIKKLIHYPQLIHDIASNHQVHLLCSYAQELAASFHSFYNQCKVIQDDTVKMQARLGLAQATKIVLADVLSVIGVSSPEEM